MSFREHYVAPSKDFVLTLHQEIVKVFGGIQGIRDESLIDSALATWSSGLSDGTEFFPEILQKIARLSYGLISNHAFLDGNKRVGLLILIILLEEHNYLLVCSDEILEGAILDVAAGRLNYEAFYEWVCQNTVKLQAG